MKKLLLALPVIFCLNSGISNAQTSLTNAVDFTVTTLEGETFNLFSTLGTGQWVMIDFFAYWCGPCADLADDFGNLFEKFGCNQEDVFMISIEGDGTETQTHDFEVANGGQGPAVSGLGGGGDAVHTTYGIAAYPTFILINPSGDIVEQDIWPFSESIGESTLLGHGLSLNACGTTGIEDVQSIQDGQVFPNPASDVTAVEFTLNQSVEMTATLFNMMGQEIRSLSQGEFQAGTHTIQVDVSELPAGQYMIQLNGDLVNQVLPVQVAH